MNEIEKLREELAAEKKKVAKYEKWLEMAQKQCDEACDAVLTVLDEIDEALYEVESECFDADGIVLNCELGEIGEAITKAVQDYYSKKVEPVKKLRAKYNEEFGSGGVESVAMYFSVHLSKSERGDWFGKSEDYDTEEYDDQI